MRSLILGAVLLSTLALSRCASATELPGESVCSIVAQADYDAAVAGGDPLPDGAYERAMGDCEDLPMAFGDAVKLAGLLGRYGVDRSLDGSGWYPTTIAEDAAADGAR